MICQILYNLTIITNFQIYQQFVIKQTDLHQCSKYHRLFRCPVNSMINNYHNFYIGRTKSSVETRMKEHESNIRSTNKKLSVISEHRIENNHDFNWKNVKILDKEPSVRNDSYKKRRKNY